MNSIFSKKGLTFLQWNCRSISPKKADLINFLKNKKIDVIILSETWLKPEQYFKFSGYNVIRKDRRDGYAGVAILINNKIRIKEKQLNNNGNTNVLACLVSLIDFKVDILSIYRPPQ